MLGKMVDLIKVGTSLNAITVLSIKVISCSPSIVGVGKHITAPSILSTKCSSLLSLYLGSIRTTSLPAFSNASAIVPPTNPQPITAILFILSLSLLCLRIN